MITFQPKSVAVNSNPIFIVGMCPGRQRKTKITRVVWEGNQSGDLMTKIIEGKSNIFLTNIFNVYLKEKNIPPTIINEEWKRIVSKRV